MNAILNRIFGTKKQTRSNLEGEIRRQETALAEARARVEAAARDRTSALDVLDRAAVRAADALKLDAAADVEIAERALAALRQAHADRQEVEAREAFQREVAAHERVADALSQRIRRDYPDAARTIARLVADLREHDGKAAELRQRAKDIGETFAPIDPEEFRHGPPRWGVRYRNPDGDGSIQCDAASAPRWAVEWISGEPIPARDHVEVWARSRDFATSLTKIDTLPGVMAGDPPIHLLPEEEERPSNAVVGYSS